MNFSSQDKLKCLTQQRDVLLSDEERFVNYLNDLEVHKRQQDQQLLETEETCASLGIDQYSHGKVRSKSLFSSSDAIKICRRQTLQNLSLLQRIK